MILHHTTPSVNLPSIEKRGIDPRFSYGRLIVVWLHEPLQTEWALAHCKERHQMAGVESLTTLSVDVPRSWLRLKKKGIWTCDRVIPPDRIVGRVTEESIRPSEILQYRERFANSLAGLSLAEQTQWVKSLMAELHLTLT